MSWFFIATLAPMLWAASNFIDKYLISRYLKGQSVGSLMLFSSLIGTALLPIIWIIQPDVIHIESLSALEIIVGSWFYLAALLPYLYAISKEDVSVVVAVFQIIPVIGFIFGTFFLHESLATVQIIGSILIILGALYINYNRDRNLLKVRAPIFLAMLLSATLFASSFFIFKVVALKTTFLTTSFWQYLGFTIFAAVIFLFVPRYRKQFVKVLRTNRADILKVNIINEIINIAGTISFNFASLLAPLALVAVIIGLQPAFSLIYGLLLTLFFPHLIKENIEKHVLTQKIIAISIIFIGTVLINL
jgi:drug/metabolite transporter (DMT)-like permease